MRKSVLAAPWLILVIAAGMGGGCSQPAGRTDYAGEPLFADDFSDSLAKWVVEQQPGGTVSVEDGRLIIQDKGGCTVWFRSKLEAPVLISYTATVFADPRLSDLNCFWMATDPNRSATLLEPGHDRTGKFANYDSLRTYYVGYGGNTNSSTRFRRYPGDGTRPLLPENDLSAPEFLLRPGHPYRIELLVVGHRVQFVRDGEVIFDFHDPDPLTEGWFGFRTVWSRIAISDFSVRKATAPHP